MAHIPKNARWFVAELVMEIAVESDARNVLHKNLMLIGAPSADEAYDRATRLGLSSEVQYENPTGKTVRISFRGIRRLDVIHDPLEHGAELLYEEQVQVPENDIRKLIPPKESLAAFRPITLSSGPDYSSREVLDEAAQTIRHSKRKRTDQ